MKLDKSAQELIQIMSIRLPGLPFREEKGFLANTPVASFGLASRLKRFSSRHPAV